MQYVAFWLRHAKHQDDATFRLCVSLFFLDLMAEHGQTFNGNARPSVQTARDSLLPVFEDSLR